MKKLVLCVFIFSRLLFSFAEEINPSVVDFYKGNIKEKILVVKKSSENGDSSVALKSIDFLIDTNDFLANDEDYNNLAEISIKSFNSRNTVGFEKQISSHLCSLFKMTESNRVKIAIIDFFNLMPTSESIQMINDFFYKKMQNHNNVDECLIKAIEFLGSKGNSASFNRLFIADILEVWPEYNLLIASSYGNLAEENRKEILQMIVSVPVDKKIAILNKINANEKISSKICGECAENVLLAIINNTEKVVSGQMEKDIITLELLCLETMSKAKWTRASDIATKSFEIIRNEYELQSISEEQFVKAIENISSIANSDTVMVLSSYLDFLNKSKESGNELSKDVVLSVINCLGELGDNRAFDFIYVATSLDYPDEVVEAAKSSITKLKW